MVLGITGNIASGKSRVASLFGQLGAVVVSADQLAREAVAPGSPALAEIVEHFGEDVLLQDGNLDREELGRRVFAAPTLRRELEAITHPAIARLAEERLAGLRAAESRLIAYEAPLLFEAGAEGRVDKVLVVTVDERVQLQRLMKRDRLDETAARQRLSSQMPQQQKASRADYLIENSSTWEACARQVTTLYAELTGTRS